MDRRHQLLSMAVAGIATLALSNASHAGVQYTSTTDASWFNYLNWSNGGTAATATNQGPASANATDNDIYGGQGYTSLTPDGVVFDPLSDPNYNTTTPPGPATGVAVNTSTYTTTQQVYVAGGQSSSTLTDVAGKLTIKSGTLTQSSTGTGFFVGRPFSSTTSNATVRGTLVLNGGSINAGSAGAIEISTESTTSTQIANITETNVLDYTNTGSITSVGVAGRGLRMGVASSAASTTLNSTLILRHVSSGTGAINLSSFIVGSSTLASTTGTVNDTLDYHYGGGNVDTINVGASGSSGTNVLTIRRGTATGGGGTFTSTLQLDLDSAPTVTGGFVQNLGLIDVQSATGITLNSSGQLTSTSGFTNVAEGGTVTATFGADTYSWTLYYDGNINGSTITGAGTGSDVVLIGNAFASTPEPASLGLLGLAGLGLVRRRRA